MKTWMCVIFARCFVFLLALTLIPAMLYAGEVIVFPGHELMDGNLDPGYGVNGNKVTITDGGNVPGWVYGARVNDARDNIVEITGGVIGQQVVGASSDTAATSNSVLIDSSTVGSSVAGGEARAGNATDNTVIVKNSDVASIDGGTSYVDAIDNTVKISGSIVNDVTGGNAISDPQNNLATNNTVTITDNTLVKMSVSGGQSGGSATENSVKINDSTAEEVYGGLAGVDMSGDRTAVTAADNNSVEVNNGDILERIFGGRAQNLLQRDTTRTNGNKVTINDSTVGDVFGGSIAGWVYEGDSLSVVSSTANNNQSVVNGSIVNGSIVGGTVEFNRTITDGEPTTVSLVADGNQIEANGNTISGEIFGGLITSSSLVNGSASASKNSILMQQTSVEEWVAGGVVFINDTHPDLVATSDSNRIESSGGKARDFVGGYIESWGTGSAAVNNNIVVLKNGGIAEEAVVGGAVRNFDMDESYSGGSAAIGNSVAIDDVEMTLTGVDDTASVGDVGVIGGVADAYIGSTVATDNTVTIRNSKIAAGADTLTFGSYGIAGGWAESISGNTESSINHVEIIGGEISGSISGGVARSDKFGQSNKGNATAMENELSVSDGIVKVRDGYGVIGGIADSHSGTAIAKGNSLVIAGGTVEVEGYGIFGGGGGAFSDSGDANATNNAVSISGGTVKGNIYGGYAESISGTATATHNTVTVGGTADLSNASVHGGGSLAQYADANSTNDFFTANTLNKNNTTAIRDAHNFEFVKFGYDGDANITDLDLSGGEVKLDTSGHTVNYNGIFSGTGSLTKIGTGVLNFGNNTNIGGKMTVREGGFAISNSLSLNTNGGLLFGAASEFTPNGNTLTVNGGGVTIDRGAFINLEDVDEGNMVLVSGDGISGSFDSMFYETELRDNNKELWVVGEFTDDEKGENIIADLANSGVTTGKNGAKGIGQLASILDSVSPEVEKELMRQLEALVVLADSGDRDAAAIGVQQILGQYSTRATQATYSIAQSFGGAVSGHLSQMRDTRMAMNGTNGARSNSAYASLRDPRSMRSSRRGYGYSPVANRIWAGGFGSFARQDDHDGESGYDYDAGGFILGYDHYFGDNVTVGFTGAYSHGRIDGNDGFSKTDVDTLNLGVYASYDTNCGFFAEGNLGFGFTWNDEEERLVLGGRRGGDFETSSFQLGGNVGYAFRLPAAFRLIPTIGLQYIHVDQDEYEQSGNILAMWRDSSSADYLEVPIAVRVNKTFELGGGVSVTPELRAAWIIEAKQDDVSVRTGFVGSNASMLVSGTNPGKHRGLIGVGVKAQLGNNIDAFVNYNLEFRNRYTNHNIMAGVGVAF